MSAKQPAAVSPVRLLRIEFTCLSPGLARSDLELTGLQRPLLLDAIEVRDALVPPFPEGGKRGISMLVGPVDKLQRPDINLLWRLEKRRGRAVVAVVTGLKGRSFMPDLRNLEAHFGEPTLTPLMFVRRRRGRWDALDFLTPGSDRSMEGANPRLRRLRQAGWEFLVDRITQLDDPLRARYFESLAVDRQSLWESLVKRFGECRVAALVGVAGNCLTHEHLYRLLDEPLFRELVEAVHTTQGERPPAQGWRILAKREQGESLLLLGGGGGAPAVGSVLRAALPTGRELRPVGSQLSEFAVASVEAVAQPLGLKAAAYWVKVQWRYRPDQLMPNEWEQISAPQAG